MSEMIRIAAEIASALDNPQRAAEMARYHRAIIGALNATHTNGEQDALALMEAFAHTLAQVFGATPADTRRGIMEYLGHRSEWLRDLYVNAGRAAEVRNV